MTGAPTDVRFAPLPADKPADELERELLEIWNEEKLFEATLEKIVAIANAAEPKLTALVRGVLEKI